MQPATRVPKAQSACRPSLTRGSYAFAGVGSEFFPELILARGRFVTWGMQDPPLAPSEESYPSHAATRDREERRRTAVVRRAPRGTRPSEPRTSTDPA